MKFPDNNIKQLLKKQFSMKKLGLLSVLTLSVLMSSCLAGVVGGTVAGVVSYKRGDLISNEGAPYKQCMEAVFKGMDELGYKVESVKQSTLWYFQETVKARSAEGKTVKIIVKWKSENHTEMKVRVGILGNKARSQEILSTIRRYIYQQ